MPLRDLETERRNRATENLDRMTSLELVTVMNREDAIVPRAIERVLPDIARAVDVIAGCFARGGRLIYVGTGTSGRIGALDASECAPTFDTSSEVVQFLIAGGPEALIHPTEACEDSAELGRADMERMKPRKRDAIVGIAASGRTPYTISAIEYARRKGATTVAIACNRGSALGRAAEFKIEVDVGPEVLAGSTRLKAGTAQKLICNMLSTGAMVRMGYVYSNLMVKLHPRNEKLVERAIAILESLARVDRDTAFQTLKMARMRLPVALVMLKAHVSKTESMNRLRKARGNVRKAIEG